MYLTREHVWHPTVEVQREMRIENNNNIPITYRIIIKFVSRLRTVFTYDTHGKLIKRHRRHRTRHTVQSRSVVGALYRCIQLFILYYYYLLLIILCTDALYTKKIDSLSNSYIIRGISRVVTTS